MFTKGFLFPDFHRLIRNRNWKFDKKRLAIPDFAFLFTAIRLFPSKKTLETANYTVFFPSDRVRILYPCTKNLPVCRRPAFFTHLWNYIPVSLQFFNLFFAFSEELCNFRAA